MYNREDDIRRGDGVVQVVIQFEDGDTDRHFYSDYTEDYDMFLENWENFIHVYCIAEGQEKLTFMYKTRLIKSISYIEDLTE